MIQDGGGFHRAWEEARRKLLAAFFGNLKAPGFSKLRALQKVRLLGKVLCPIFVYYAQPWPPTQAFCMTINRFQRKLIAMAVGINEDFPSFARRRSRQAASLIEETDSC